LGWDLASRLTGDLKECGGWANRYRERISRQGGERFCESGEGVKDGTQNYYQTATQCQDDGNKYGKKGTAFFSLYFPIMVPSRWIGELERIKAIS
jgi:hypothetical protein